MSKPSSPSPAVHEAAIQEDTDRDYAALGARLYAEDCERRAEERRAHERATDERLERSRAAGGVFVDDRTYPFDDLERLTPGEQTAYQSGRPWEVGRV
jgi:hypothetical protein